ncbi:leucine Rich Repeat [Seminavis robusta]|uniref:Leucine Rich Repeat n=1 Tax=Seminavis robusta TaxID=568900 RepID=A0A9N8HGP0_9STRA|nr:leucine Rich Repeat [Seminavis robusta]|eukprot:Sro519_g158990.1 leucine Rich Repeat (795) ;mRNA; r:31517-34108
MPEDAVKTSLGQPVTISIITVPQGIAWARMERPAAAQIMDDEEELMDIVAGRSCGDNREAELRKLEVLELAAQQRQDEQSKREGMERSFQLLQQHPSTAGDKPMGEEIDEEAAFSLKAVPVQEQIKNHRHVRQDTSETPSTAAALEDHPSTTGDKPTGEEIKESENEHDAFVLKVVQERIKNHRQVTSETPSAEAGLEDELAFPHPRLTRGQNQPDEPTMHPGAYAVAPGTDLQRTATLRRSLVGGATLSSDELPVGDSSDEELRMSSANARNQSTVNDQATTPTNNNNGLSVANQVEENEEPTQIARPDNLPGKNGSTSVTLMIYVLIGSLLLVGVIVGSICGAGLCSNREGNVETQAPTSFRYFVLEDIKNRIEETFGRNYFPENEEPEPTQPKFKALDWIVFEDPLQLNPDANNILQRFILSLTYFQTSQEGDWLYCGPSETADDETCWHVESLASRWLTGVHECQWAGIGCNRVKNITQLELRDNGLNGPLPTELASLSTLEGIDFEGNQLTGTVPSIYGSSTALSLLNLVDNQLSGSIPLELFGNDLSYILLRNNSLTGTMPTEIGLFDGATLGFGSNSLSGSIPTELFQVGKVIQKGNLLILFHDNKLTGTLPTEIGALHVGRNSHVFLQGNQLHGTIPSEIGLLKGSLKELAISRTNMDGSLPEELFTSCTNLVALKASNSGLTGTISIGLQRLTKLQIFDISNNKFHGTIPAQLSALTRLQRFSVNGNDLSGSIPSSVCTLADPLKGSFAVAADCLPRGGTGYPMVECSCCTLCCDGEAADYCLPT